MKYILITVSLVALVFLILSYLDVFTSRYVPFISYLVIFVTLIVTLVLRKKGYFGR